jgi:glucose-1-phosphate cytidylyltransferase
MLTYGDGVSNINLNELEKYHKEHGKIATLSTINFGQQFGVLDIDASNHIKAFREKEDSDGSMINIGFMVMNPEVFDYIEGDSTVLEKQPLEKLAAEGQLMGFEHKGFWKCMDAQRDKMKLEELWQSGNAPWKVWE